MLNRIKMRILVIFLACAIRLSDAVVREDRCRAISFGPGVYINTFDGDINYFQGACKYNMVNMFDNVMPDRFQISMKHEVVNITGTVKQTVLQYAEINVKNYSVRVYVNGSAAVNTRLVLPNAQYQFFTIESSPLFVRFRTEYALGIIVECFRTGRCTVDIHKSYGGHITGLYGNCDGKRETNSEGINKDPIIGDKFFVKDGDEMCTDVTAHVEPLNIEIAKSATYCGKETLCASNKFIEFCAYAVASWIANNETVIPTIICNAIDHCVTDIVQNGALIDWRKDASCIITCPENSVFKHDAPACLPTCRDRQPSCDDLPRRENCVCKEGWVFEDGACREESYCDAFLLTMAFAYEGYLQKFRVRTGTGKDAYQGLQGHPDTGYVFTEKHMDDPTRRDWKDFFVFSYSSVNEFLLFDPVFETVDISFDITGAYPTGCHYSLYSRHLARKQNRPRALAITDNCNPHVNTSDAISKYVGHDTFPTFHVSCTKPVSSRHVHVTFDRVDDFVIIKNIVMHVKAHRYIEKVLCTSKEYPRLVVFHYGNRNEFTLTTPGFNGSLEDGLYGSGHSVEVPGYKTYVSVKRTKGGKFVPMFHHCDLRQVSRKNTKAPEWTNELKVSWHNTSTVAYLAEFVLEACLPPM